MIRKRIEPTTRSVPAFRPAGGQVVWIGGGKTTTIDYSPLAGPLFQKKRYGAGARVLASSVYYYRAV